MVDDRVGRTDRATVVAAMLAREPLVHVTAIAHTGVFVPIPPSVPLRGHRVISQAVTALDLVVPDDRRLIIDGWQSATDTGVGRCDVHLAVAPETVAALHFVDVREDHGVFLGFLVGAPAQDLPAVGPDFPALRPRYGIVHKSPLSVVVDFDDSAEQMLGWSREEIIGTRSLELTHPEDHERAIANFLDMVSNPGAATRVRLRQRRGDGEWVWFEITNHNRINDLGYVLAEMVDISDEMSAMEALRAGEELLRRLTEALPVGVVQLDRDGLVVYANDRVRTVLERPVETGRKGDELLAEPAFDAAVGAALGEGRDADLELEVPVGQGISRTVQVAVRALGDGGAVATFTDVTAEARLRDELQHRATYDALTGCHTRRALMERLEALLAQGSAVSAFFVDLDGFKQVNDEHGHAVGDALLAHVGRCLREGLDAGDLVGRLGGDEFLVVRHGATGTGTPEADVAAADRLAALIGTPLALGPATFVARASVGVARSTPGMDADALVASADALMYQVKTERRRSPRD